MTENNGPWFCDTCGMKWDGIPFACCGTSEFHQEMPLCARGGSIWLNHSWKLGKCQQCGLEQPKAPGVIVHKKP